MICKVLVRSWNAKIHELELFQWNQEMSRIMNYICFNETLKFQGLCIDCLDETMKCNSLWQDLFQWNQETSDFMTLWSQSREKIPPFSLLVRTFCFYLNSCAIPLIYNFKWNFGVCWRITNLTQSSLSKNKNYYLLYFIVILTIFENDI